MFNETHFLFQYFMSQAIPDIYSIIQVFTFFSEFTEVKIIFSISSQF